MELKVGMYLRVETKPSPGQKAEATPFGTVVWQITEMGLPFRVNKDTTLEGKGVKCVMIGGSGPSARAGYSCVDNIDRMMDDIKKGISKIVNEQEAKRLEAFLKSAGEKAAKGGGASAGAVGCVEID